MIYAYIRVSTDKQTLGNQEYEINNFCKKKEIKIDKWIMETISGTKDFEKRRLGLTLKKLKKEDIIICSEISRLGRNMMQIMTILNICLKKEAQVWTIKDNYRLGTDIQSKVLAFAFGLVAEIEHNLISQRTKEALARIKTEGKKIGRKYGSKNRKHKIDGHEDEIVKLYQAGTPKRHIAQIYGVSTRTIYNYLVSHALN